MSSGATQVCWLLGPRDPPGVAQEDGVPGSPGQESQQCLSGPAHRSLCRWGISSRSGSNQLSRQSILLQLHVAVAKETVLVSRQLPARLPRVCKCVWRPRPEVTLFSQEKLRWGIQGMVSRLFRKEGGKKGKKESLVPPDIVVSELDAWASSS